jgi:DNA invertase Pin-like site-specific DNA recombinase
MGVLSKETRALIDAALAEGRKTDIPTGVFGEPSAYTHWKAGRPLSAATARVRGTSPAVVERRTRVLELAKDGANSAKMIADELGVSAQMVHNDINALRRSAMLPGRGQ